MSKLKRILLWIALIFFGFYEVDCLIALFGESGSDFLLSVVITAVILFFIIRALRKPSAKKQAQRSIANNWDGGEDEYLIKMAAAANNLIRNAPRPIPGLGYYNMPKFAVAGVNSSTKRKKTLHIRAQNADMAQSIAEAQGLIEPITVEEESFWAATGKSDYGYTIPLGACRDDAFELENSASACDGDPISSSFMDFLTEAGIPCSRIAGRNSAMQKLLKTLTPRERAALFGYAVDRSLYNRPLDDISAALASRRYQSFAEAIETDSVASRSLSERPPADYWEPSKRSAAYKFAIDYLGGQMEK